MPSSTSGIATLKNLKGSTPTGSPTDKAHHHHHHHHGQKSGHAPQGGPSKPAAPIVPPRPKVAVSSNAVLESVAQRPRHHLGDFMYEPDLKPGRILPNTPTNRGFCSNPKPLPWDRIKENENCTLTVKVPRIHLSPVAREEITSRAYLWGSDVYTDDSDVVAACIHSGWIRGEWTDDVDTSLLDLDGAASGKRKPRLPLPEASDYASENTITSPPEGGPMGIPANRDLHITVLILPRLVKYFSCTRFGITSREFGGQHGNRFTVHDGISYMIKSIRWVENGAQPQARLRGKGRRERMRKAFGEVTIFGNNSGPEIEQAKETPSALNSGWNGHDTSNRAEAGDKARQDRAVSEGNKENGREGDVPEVPAIDVSANEVSHMADAEARLMITHEGEQK